MSDARRDEILRLAQTELVRGIARRATARRAILGSGVVVTALAVLFAAQMFLRPALHGSGALAGTATPDSPSLPEPAPVPMPAPIPARAPALVLSHSEISHQERPSAGFIEILDDQGLERVLLTLDQPAGIAVIDGHARIVPHLASAARDSPL